MTANGIFQILLFIAAVIAVTMPMGAYMAKVFAGERTWVHRIAAAARSRRSTSSAASMKTAEQHWTRYAGGVLAFSLVSILLTYCIQRLQQWFPLNPQGLGNVGAALAFNTATSFGTNTNWQSYTPETTMSYSHGR